MTKLFVKNDKGEEFVCNINSKYSELPSKIVVTNYTRDPKILSTISLSKTFSITPESEDDKKRFFGFYKYLQDRGKAGTVVLETTRTVYVVPPSTKDTEKNTDKLNCALFVGGFQVNANSSSSFLPSTTPVVTAAAATAVKSSSSEDFLSSLLSKVEETVKTRAPGVYSKPQQEDRRVLLERRVRAQIEAFVDANRHLLAPDEDSPRETNGHGDAGVLVLEPMEKDLRFIVHEVVENSFADTLVSVSAGDDDERHVEIYIRGFEPVVDPGLELLEGDKITSSVGRKSRGKSSAGTVSGADSAKPLTADALMRVGLVKRDRRTIEEVQQMMKKRRGEC